MKYIAFFAMTLLVCLYSACPAFALSDADYKKFMKESLRFSITDKKLSATWKLIKNANGGQIPSSLMAEQKRWIQVERDSEAKALFGKMTPADAYADVTNKRIEKLTSMWLRENTAQAASAQSNSGQGSAASPKVGDSFTVIGKAYEMVAHGENNERIPVDFLEEKSTGAEIRLDNMRNSTKNFISCYDEGKYNNRIIEITAQVTSTEPIVVLKIDKSSICKFR